jgi:type IV pilus assembly protein PilB
MEEAISRLKTTRPTFYRWLRSGRLKGMKVGRQWRFLPEDIDRFLTGQGPRIDLPADIDPLIDALLARVRKAGGRPVACRDNDKIAHAVSLIVQLGLTMNASDIHIEPQEKAAQLRLRVDGPLHLVCEFDSRLLPAIVERWKTMAAMDTREKSLPQDGRIIMSEDDISVDLRVCCVPSCLGETIVARVLRSTELCLDLAKLPYADADRKRIDRWLAAPWGLIIITGPTGCGKTTTLYCCLTRLADGRSKVISVEDPVEYVLRGMTQIQINPKAGLSFERAMRSTLRMDPDVIMMGEIRGADAMGLCFQAALTGHLVLTTLHVDEAAAALRRLTDLGAEPFLVGDATKLIVAQRLVRLLCPDCSKEALPPADQLARAERMARAGGLSWDTLPRKFRRAVGCSRCGQLGFRGRTIIAETLGVTPEVASALRRRAATEEIRAIAVGQGMTTLAADGIRRAASGLVSLEEVLSTVAGISY